MKKLIGILAFIATCYAGRSQELGARFGDVVGNAVAVDALFSTGKYSRIHADVSFGDGVGVEVLWDFLYRPINGEAFHWYGGAGVSTLIDDPFRFGISAEVGLSYKFNKIPLSLSSDWRPTFYVTNGADFAAGGFGCNIRYVFGGKKSSTP